MNHFCRILRILILSICSTTVCLGHTKILDEFKRCQDVNIAVTFHMQKLPSTHSLGGTYSNTNLTPSPYLDSTLPHNSTSAGPESQVQVLNSFENGHKSRSETSLFNRHSSRRGLSSTGCDQHPKEFQKITRSNRNSSCHSVLRKHSSADANNQILVHKKPRRRSEDNLTVAQHSDSSVDVKRNNGMSRKIRSLKYRRHATTSLIEIESGVFSASQNYASNLTDRRLWPENLEDEHCEQKNNNVDKQSWFASGGGTIDGSKIYGAGFDGSKKLITGNGQFIDQTLPKMENFKHFTTLTIETKNNKNSKNSNSSLVHVGRKNEDEHGMVEICSPTQNGGNDGVKVDRANNKSCYLTDEQTEKMNLYCQSNISDIKNGGQNQNENMNGSGGNANLHSQNMSPLFEARNRRRRKNSSRRGSSSGNTGRQTSDLSQSEHFRLVLHILYNELNDIL